MRRFELSQSPLSERLLCIQAHDLSQEEADRVRGIVSNNYMDSEDYKVCKPTGAFNQGYNSASAPGRNDAWVMVEFWSSDRKAIDRFVAYVNEKMQIPTCSACGFYQGMKPYEGEWRCMWCEKESNFP